MYDGVKLTAKSSLNQFVNPLTRMHSMITNPEFKPSALDKETQTKTIQ